MIKKIIRIGKKESISVVSEAISSLVEITMCMHFSCCVYLVESVVSSLNLLPKFF